MNLLSFVGMVWDPTLPRGTQFGVAPWHLLATLRLDGRQEPERRNIIYLDDSHPNFHNNWGEVLMKSSIVKDELGYLRDHGWLFKEVGIESVNLDKLQLGDDEIPVDEAHDLTTALGGLGTNLEDAEQKATVGQIEITFERVEVSKSERTAWDDADRPTLDKDLHPSDMTNVSHTVARDLGKRKLEVIKFVDYKKVIQDEAPYATFRFYYRDEGEFSTRLCRANYVLTTSTDRLRKYGFPGFPPKAPSRVRESKKAISQAAAAPLGINQQRLKSSSNYERKAADWEDVQTADTVKNAPDPTASTNTPWIPKDNRFPSSVTKDLSSDLPNSAQNLPAPGNESENTPKTITPREKFLRSFINLRARETDQSSADESSPLKQEKENIKPNLMTDFRGMTNENTEGDEADDEASNGSRSMSFSDDTGDEVGDEFVELSRDEEDGGLRERLSDIQIGSKRGSNDDDDGQDHVSGFTSTTKKVRITLPNDVSLFENHE